MPQYNGVWTIEAAAQAQSNQQWVTDPNFRNTTLLLQADNAGSGAQNNSFSDSSSNGFAITRNGNTTQGTFTPFSQAPGRWSTYYTGVADNNATYLATNAAYSFGTGDFTVEAWVNIPPIANTNGKVIVDSRPDSTNGAYWIFSLTNNGRLNATTMSTGGVTISSTNPIPTNEWVHVAYTRRSGTLNLWVNGLSVATASGNTDNISSSTLWIGRLAFSSVAADSWFAGYMSNLRIVKGVAVYTGNFTPQTTPLTATQPSGVNIAAITGSQTSLLMQQSNRFVDNSSIAAPILTLNTWPSIQTFSPFAPQFQWTPAVIGGSGYFDGSGDWLSAAYNSAFDLSTGDFTIEGWVYPTSYSGTRTIACLYGSGGIQWIIETVGANWDVYVYPTGVNLLIYSSAAPAPNQWAHFALVRDGANFKFYVQGVLLNTVASQTLRSTAQNLNVGCYSDGGGGFYSGNISQLRIVKGTAVYTGAFTPPIAPLYASGAASASSYSSTTNVNTSFAAASTSVLLSFTNAGIYDGTMKNNLETVGNAQVNTSVVKYGSGSMLFDGTGDYLFVPRWTGINANENFTAELWVNLTAAQANYRMMLSDSNGNSSKYWTLNATGMEAQFGTIVSTSAVCTFTFTPGVWYHLALVRNNGVVSMYVNGIAQTVTYPNQTASYLDQNSILQVGRWLGTTTTYEFFGYMDDLRITKGIARYTANFIPPQVALPRQ